MRNRVAASVVAVVAALACSSVVSAQRGQARQGGAPAVKEGFISEGIPKMPNPPGPAPKRDLSGAWVGPGATNKPEPVPPMTPAGQARFKQSHPYPSAGPGGGQDELASNDPFITCDPLGFPRNLLAHAITNRGGTLFGSAPNRILIAYEQQRVWREIWTDGRALPTKVDVRGAPESRYYGYSVGHWERDTFVVDSIGHDDRTWIDHFGYPHSDEMHLQERYRRVAYDTLELNMWIEDPKVYARRWNADIKRFKLLPKDSIKTPEGWTGILEDLCAPVEDIDQFIKRIRDPAGGVFHDK